MNGQLAKRIRKRVYGDFALRPVGYERLADGSIRCVGRRGIYLKAKSEVRSSKKWST